MIDDKIYEVGGRWARLVHPPTAYSDKDYHLNSSGKLPFYRADYACTDGVGARTAQISNATAFSPPKRCIRSKRQEVV
jgi:hypothetical protein